MTRKRTKLLIVTAMAVFALVATTATAFASWCWSDPIIGLNVPGYKEADVSIDVAVPEDRIKQIAGPIIIEVRIPMNVKARVKFKDGILDEEVVFVRTTEYWTKGEPINTEINVIVSSHEDFEVGYRVTHGKKDKSITEVFGRTNERVQYKAEVQP